MRPINHVALVFAFIAVPAHFMACGGAFPIELTEQRKATLFGLYEGNFWFEAGQLKPKPAFQFAKNPGLAVYRNADGVLEDLPAERIAIETAGYSEVQRAAFQRARSASNATEAFTAAESLPKVHQLYIAGAVSFRKAQWQDARDYFDQVIAFTDPETNDRLLWAHYMRGLSLYEIAQSGDGNLDAAIAAFDSLRKLAQTGKSDELGLALTSLGDQARWHLRANELVPAAHLYAQQASMEESHATQVDQTDESLWQQPGQSQGAHGLLISARRIYQDQENLAHVLQDDLVRQLMIVYAYARAGEIAARDGDINASFHELSIDYDVVENARQNAGAEDFTVARGLSKVLAQAAKGKSQNSARLLDRLAAVLYRAGEFDAALDFAKLSDAPLAAWVQAKLALRAGNYDQATDFYANAAQSFPKDDAWLQDYDSQAYNVACRVRGESATMHLVRGDFTQAAELFWQAKDYWRDLSYVAERVLSIDELRTFVQKHAAQPVPQAPANASDTNDQPALLRLLFARRLMRQEHYREAVRYFDEPGNKQNASQFAMHMEQAAQSNNEQRAEHFYQAARLAREEGIRLFAYELSPDQASWGGSTSGGSYSYDDVGGYRALPKTKFVQTYATPQEQARYIQTQANPMMFFHYRARAALLAEQASLAVPERSQAFAALLCKATLWTNDLNMPLGQKFYRHYLNVGPYVPWGEEFGVDCPEPNFASAADLRATQRKASIKKLLKQWSIPGALGFGTLLLWVAYRWRKQKALHAV